MTAPINNNRRSPAPSTQNLNPLPAENGTSNVDGTTDAVEDMSLMAPQQAATFAAAKPYQMFNPPQPPALLDETKASDPAAAHRENRTRIEQYNKGYNDYLTRCIDIAGTKEVDSDTIRKIPAPYKALANLPATVSDAQRRDYELMKGDTMDRAKRLADILGDRMLTDNDIKGPGAAATVDVKATLAGNGVRLKGDSREGIEKLVGVGLNNGLMGGKAPGAPLPGSEEAEKLAKAAHVEGGATVWINPETGKSETSVYGRVGQGEGWYGGLEWEGKQMTTDFGARAELGEDLEGSLGVYNGTDGDSISAGVEGGLKAFNVDLEAKAGGNMQLASTEYIRYSQFETPDGFAGAGKKEKKEHGEDIQVLRAGVR